MQTESQSLEADGVKLLEAWKIAQQNARRQVFENNKKFRACNHGQGIGPTEEEIDLADQLLRLQDDAWMLVEDARAKFIAALRTGR